LASPCAAEPDASDARRLIWSDEFDYEGLPDPLKWGYAVGGHGWGNNESQFYTEARKENARVEGGRLIIEAHRETWGAQDYTSTRLISRHKGDWTYGRIVIRAKMPHGRGTWPALWLRPTNPSPFGGWPNDGEIDIMEYVGYNPGVVHGTVHCRASNWMTKNAAGASVPVLNAESAFHDYAVEWTPDKIVFSVDGMDYHAYLNKKDGWESWPFDAPFYLIMNLAIGGWWGAKQGIDETLFPQRLEVDYVRVYAPL
jgi:beta-glucanase (GH16 family)